MNKNGRRLIILLTAAVTVGCGDAGLFELGRTEPLVVRVTGRNFQWYFTYPGADGEFDTADDVDSPHNVSLPKGYNVQLHVTSEDYLYAFRAPELALREVAVPGMNFLIDFKTDRTGRFELEVDPMCGFDFLHANRTMGHVIVSDTFDNVGRAWWSHL